MNFSNVKLPNNILVSKLSSLDLQGIAIESGFIKRCRKVLPIHFLVGFFVINLHKSYSLCNWSAQIGLLFGVSVTKQGLWKRLNSCHSIFIDRVLKKAMLEDLQQAKKQLAIGSPGVLDDFNRVLLQDSTNIHLPDKLSHAFKGNWSRGKTKALAKIQAIVDIKTNQFVHLELGDFSKNDQKASKDILPLLCERDLIIRDLGYFSADVFQQIEAEKAFFITKIRSGINLYSLNGDQLNLTALLKKNNTIDNNVTMTRKQVPVRLIARKLDDRVAEKRRREAKKNRDKRLNHNQDYYFLLGYEIYITNVDDQALSPKQVAKIYALRWRIEIIFKAWKSHLNLDKCIHQGVTYPNKVIILITYVLLFATLFVVQLYNHYWLLIYSKHRKYLSLLKFSRFIADNLLLLISQEEEDQAFMEQIITKACCYEKRKDRQSYGQKSTHYFTLS